MDQCKVNSQHIELSDLPTSETMLRVHSVESFGSVDGPGIRFVIFLKGCAMRCQYCHNPDTWDRAGGNLRSVDDVLSQALRYRSYWGEKGGITVSGGEALLQIQPLTELFHKAKDLGINTCLDTSAQPFSRKDGRFSAFEALMKYTDLVLLDIKHIDNDAHKRLTGWENENILDCARYLSDIHKPVWIRHVLVPGINDDDESLHRLRSFIDTLSNVERVEVLPYHDLGVYKWEQLGIPYKLTDVKPPTEESVLHARKILTE
ncbi:MULTISPECIES: pyruvate formate-lyase-activating protein [Prevotella]|jgi:pyruvate formate-lyase 1-activating enzyme|uniref:Pyruvate formate-lyase-activating enzyme n=1 Tax=Prevotella jejuni TaxID=1177574 RepID=A0AA94ISF3_9BACT|nr:MULTISPECIES: pyruvate formate-lyase-activating protein [Prevotella]QUB77546.1 pyruvate formate lyase-activating protein [Prevotella jejuni]SNR64853.1 pyruvate formate lyase activating enzyme [Prevotella jejuni]